MRFDDAVSPNERIASLIRRVDGDHRSGEVLWRVRSDDGSVDCSYGDRRRPFFIASATKLFVTAILAQLRAEGRLDWDAPMPAVLPDLDLRGLRPDPEAMTVRSVMAHTAGLADYFEGKRPSGPSTFAQVLTSDFAWDLADVMAWTAQLPPARAGKGRYSDTGYQLLGAVIERVDGRPFAEAVRARITEPLALPDTWCFTMASLDRYDEVAALLHGPDRLRIPLAMASVQADGGIVSTLDDGIAFLDAFFGGRLFPGALLAEIATDWHRIFPPLQYGTGIMRFRMNRLLTGFRALPPFVGHSGASGTVMFRAPELGLTIVGTVNQLRYRSMPFQLMVRTALVR